MLVINGLNAWYGESHVLRNLCLNVEQGEIVSLLGRNGSGRTTTLRSILGLLQKCSGSIRLYQKETVGLSTHDIVRLGKIGYCPEYRGIFSSLTVQENLMLPPTLAQGGMPLDRIYQMFPNLRTRIKTRGGMLSGGEQQMLALARILRTGATLLLFDELTEGLAPVVVEELGRVVSTLRDDGYTILLAEQRLDFVSMLADRNYVLENGSLIDTINKSEIEKKKSTIQRYLSV